MMLAFWLRYWHYLRQMPTNVNAYPFLFLIAMGGNVWYLKILYIILVVLVVPLVRIVDDRYDIIPPMQSKTPPT